jgi:hypothetical protein
MSRKSSILVLALALAFNLSADAKIWRINNTVGVAADFINVADAVNSASVLPGDTLYIEPSRIDYSGSVTLNKRLILIGTGYFLDPANLSTPANTGLQATPYPANHAPSITIANGGNGSVISGLMVGGITINPTSAPVNLLIERCLVGTINFSAGTHSGITVRKCFFPNAAINATVGSVSNFTCENTIFFYTFGYLNMPILTGNNNIVRNNTFYQVGVNQVIPNCYIANNIFQDGGNPTFTNSIVKNNLFSGNPSLSGTATNNLVNVNMNDVFQLGSGSLDSRVILKAGSPAIGAGLTVGAVVSPDCGAYGATDPYRLSGIPGIPTIYSLTVPTSIPSGTPTMNVTFSTKNNN